jgi:SAM-dependent methyltransferase
MTEWVFWGDRRISGVYENIYLRTFVEDWFNIVEAIAKEIKGRLILDVGCGEGHTTKQILNKLKIDYVCDIIEPNEEALKTAKEFLSFENKLGDSFADTLASFKTNKKYDVVFTSHTNYYWADNEKEFENQLDKIFSFVKPDGKLMILTLPKESDHYNIMLKQVYPEFNYAEYILNHYKKKGLKVKTIRFKMRMFVGDMLDNNGNLYDIINFYKFIHNNSSAPNKEESLKFLEKIKEHQVKGYLDFKDELIIVSGHA